jgi:hypothetical protein
MPDTDSDPQYWFQDATPFLYIVCAIQKISSQSAKVHHNNNYIFRCTISFRDTITLIGMQSQFAIRCIYIQDCLVNMMKLAYTHRTKKKWVDFVSLATTDDIKP